MDQVESFALVKQFNHFKVSILWLLAALVFCHDPEVKVYPLVDIQDDSQRQEEHWQKRENCQLAHLLRVHYKWLLHWEGPLVYPQETPQEEAEASQKR
jgi:hypothetical protein